MSFCTDVKNELAGIKPSNCCKPSLLYGFMLFSRFFCYNRISMQTSNPVMAQTYARLAEETYKATVTVTSGGGKRITYKAEVPSGADRLKILASVDYGVCPDSINTEFIKRNCCAAAFIRGAFLACGSVSDPEKEYRAEFSVRDERLANDFKRLLEKHSVVAGLSRRGNAFVVYVNQNEMIVNLLTLIGTSHRSLEMIETAVIKSVKNNINRARNCDSGNISKTVEASIAQRTAIDYLQQAGRLETLAPELLSVALLRQQNPEATLHELCRLSNEPITVSGLNHRLKRILSLYDELKNS